MTRRVAAAIAASALAVGILIGSAATVLVGEATDGGWTATNRFSMPMTGGAMPGAMNWLGADEMLALHAEHHASAR